MVCLPTTTTLPLSQSCLLNHLISTFQIIDGRFLLRIVGAYTYTSLIGCGIDDQLYDWQENAGDQLFTAAGSQNLFGDGTWCGSGCGQCYELTNTGMIADYGQGDCSGAGQTITVMITNLCPADSNQQWCSMPDAYGYPVHFDIMAQGSPQGWSE